MKSPLWALRCFHFHYIADKLRKDHDELLLQQDMSEKKKQAALHTDLTHYRATQQHADSEDADLKCDLRGAFRITIPERELGPASMQIFQVGFYNRQVFCVH